MELKERPCLVCGLIPTDRCHVKTRGAGGRDEEWNLMALCRDHHMEQHRIGIITFARRYSNVLIWLMRNDWQLDSGRLIRVHTP